ncbi:MAG: MFS transporter [Rhodococcus sp. (in: high G+C Gram-positive bacteria)]|uniref:MFS transporter n=1 Tax=Rhodococcus sp. TaxID=1831 RepID=UPI003BB8157C
MFELLDQQQKLSRRQLTLAVIAAWAVCLEFLDYFLIGFILTFVAGPWNLSFGQSSIILLSSGVGAIIGAIFFGRLADRIGRRRVFLMTILIFTAATAALALTPDSASYGWLYLTFFRVVIGFGAGGLYVVDLPLVQEYMPAAKRGRVAGVVTASVPLGFLAGSLMVWLLADVIGWRGILVVAAAMGFLVLLLRLGIPESPRYLARNGDLEGARRSIAWALDRPIDDVPPGIGVVDEAASARTSFRDLIRYPRSFWTSVLANLGMQTGYYGLTLWTPTLLIIVVGISPTETGFFMIFVTLGALAGRFALSYLSEVIGRRLAGGLAGIGAAVTTVLAGMIGNVTWMGISAFFLIMIVVYFFGEGGFAIVGPYSAEVWPSKLRTTGMGFSYGIGGLGKIIGPLGLGLILGSSNLVKPEASEQNLLPGFSYFAAWYLLCAAMFLFVGFETRGKSIEALDNEIEKQRTRGRGTPVS